MLAPFGDRVIDVFGKSRVRVRDEEHQNKHGTPPIGFLVPNRRYYTNRRLHGLNRLNEFCGVMIAVRIYSGFQTARFASADSQVCRTTLENSEAFRRKSL